MNNQQIFDKVAEHLLIQNQQSRRETFACYESNCAYYSDNGLKCAVGCLIPERLYSESMEGRSVDSILENCPILKEEKIFNKRNLRLLYDLQRIHDYYEPGEWKSKLKIYARKFRLNYSILNKFNQK